MFWPPWPLGNQTCNWQGYMLNPSILQTWTHWSYLPQGFTQSTPIWPAHSVTLIIHILCSNSFFDPGINSWQPVKTSFWAPKNNNVPRFPPGNLQKSAEICQGAMLRSRAKACGHSPHFSQALIAALKATKLKSLGPAENMWVNND